MKLKEIKTAKVRAQTDWNANAYQEVNVEKVIEVGGEIFIVHRVEEAPHLFRVSHYKTGFATITAASVERAETLFLDFIGEGNNGEMLRDVVRFCFNLYGAANEMEGEQ
jgi:hypothetical protein